MEILGTDGTTRATDAPRVGRRAGVTAGVNRTIGLAVGAGGKY